MTEKGKIREIKDNIVIVDPDRSATCFGCMNHECKSGLGFITAENPLALPLEAGQTVEMQAPPGIFLVKQGLNALMPPILGFLAGFIFVSVFFPNAGEAAAAGTGVIFLFAAAIIIYRTKRKKAASREFTVTRIID